MKPLKFKKGALHAELGVPQGQKIPAAKMNAAASGKDGPLAEKRADFARNVLHDKVGVKTAAEAHPMGSLHKHLGRFTNPKFLNQGHNSTRIAKVVDPYPHVSDTDTY